MDETKTDRVKHHRTGAAGTVTARWVEDGPYIGDLAGPWAQVQFDDGLECSVPEAELVPEDEASEGEPRRLELPHMPFADQNDRDRHALRERVAFYAPGLRPDAAMRKGHWDLETQRGALDDKAVLPLRVLVELLDRLDREVSEARFAPRRVARPVGPCPCECNSDGFCGGCGHAGCGGRR